VKSVKGAKVRMIPQASPGEHENRVLTRSPRALAEVCGPWWPFVDAGILGSGAENAETGLRGSVLSPEIGTSSSRRCSVAGLRALGA
jgi:hypothetical protein